MSAVVSADANSVFVCVLSDDVDRCVLPLFPGTPLTPTSLLSLKQSQIGSAVSLLEFYCRKNYWSLPEYHLYSTPGQDGKLLLLYKVFTTIPVHDYRSDQQNNRSVLNTSKGQCASDRQLQMKCYF